MTSNHDHVSPFTKGADNVDSKIMVILQDWASEEDLNKPFDKASADQVIGYTPTAPTNRNLEARLKKHFDVAIKDTYATNLFPFVKPGKTSATIPYSALKRAATVYAKPQFAIVQPLLVIALGHLTFWAIAEALEHKGHSKLKDSIRNPVDNDGYRVWCQAHTAWDSAKLGSLEAVDMEWVSMSQWYKRELARRRQ
jgi:uracil-DNA glycosylase